MIYAVFSKSPTAKGAGEMRRIAVILLLISILVPTWNGFAEEISHIFGIGEKIGYQLHAKGLYMGDQTVELESIDQLNGKEIYKLRGLTLSSRFVNLFFPVDDKWLVYIDKEMLMPLKLEKDMLEGKKKAFLIYFINQEDKRVVFENVTNGSIEEKEGEHPVFDLFSVIYYYRQYPEAFDGEGFTFEFLEEKGLSTVQFRNAGETKIKVLPISNSKKIPAYKLMQVGGIGIEIYVSTDDLRIPLKVISPVRMKKNRKFNVEMNLHKYQPGKGQKELPELYRELTF
jgi:hypothetical protein